VTASDGRGDRIGVLDWGIGGIDTLMRLAARLPDRAFVYWSDSGFTPYGKVPAEALAARIREIARRMQCETLVVACNAASTVLASLDLPVPVYGVIAPGIAAALASGVTRIGILGGDRTIAAGLHARALAAAGRFPIPVAAQPLSAHVEAGRLDGPEVLADILPLADRLADAEAILLACTHYPALRPVFERVLPGRRWLDPVDPLVDDVARAMAGGSRPATEPRLIVGTTGDPEATRTAAWRAFGAALPTVVKREL
jgi:glutamate racemase